MITFRLFDIPKDLNKNKLQSEFEKVAKIAKIFVKADNKKQNFQFGEIEFENLKDKNSFFSKCKEYKIKPVEKKKDSTQEVKVFETKSQTVPPKTQQVLRHSSIANPSFHFYKDKAYGKGIEDFTLTNNFENYFKIDGTQTFELTTIYPGLLVGSGYNHPKLSESKDDFQLGFFFDHTTGLPIISGSSIKGLLRSVCEKKEFMEDVYGQTVDLKIFEDNQTIFYDAFIISSQNKQNKIFGSDYITTHFSNEPDGMFKEPNPVKFLKVLPDVTFKFQFKAKEPDNVVDTFKQIILDFGLGAKTNVGYGKFTEN